MSDADVAVARFDFTSGTLRGTHLTLYPGCLVHRGDSHLETVPLAALAAVRVGFERDARRIGWGAALIVLGLLLLALASPLGTFASGAAAEMAEAGTQGVARGLYAFFRFVGAVASVMPAIAIACMLGGGALGWLGWMGQTTLRVTLPGTERLYPARGRDARLLDFAQTLSERVMTPPPR